jgi:Cu2+-exporting ATPase
MSQHNQGPTGHSTHSEQADHSGQSDHAGHSDHVGQFRRMFWVMLVVAVPVVGFSGMFSLIVCYELPGAVIVAWI